MAGKDAPMANNEPEFCSNWLKFLRSRFNMPRDKIKFRMPGNEYNQIQNPPDGYITVFEQTFRSGVRIPFTQFLLDVLTFYEISLTQLTPNALRKLVGFQIQCLRFGYEPNLEWFRFLYMLSPRKECYAFQDRAGFPKVLKKLATSIKEWRGRFFYLSKEHFPEGYVHFWHNSEITKIKSELPGDVNRDALDKMAASPIPCDFFDERVLVIYGLSQVHSVPDPLKIMASTGEELVADEFLRLVSDGIAVISDDEKSYDKDFKKNYHSKGAKNLKKVLRGNTPSRLSKPVKIRGSSPRMLSSLGAEFFPKEGPSGIQIGAAGASPVVEKLGSSMQDQGKSVMIEDAEEGVLLSWEKHLVNVTAGHPPEGTTIHPSGIQIGVAGASPVVEKSGSSMQDQGKSVMIEDAEEDVLLSWDKDINPSEGPFPDGSANLHEGPLDRSLEPYTITFSNLKSDSKLVNSSREGVNLCREWVTETMLPGERDYVEKRSVEDFMEEVDLSAVMVHRTAYNIFLYKQRTNATIEKLRMELNEQKQINSGLQGQLKSYAENLTSAADSYVSKSDECEKLEAELDAANKRAVEADRALFNEQKMREAIDEELNVVEKDLVLLKEKFEALEAKSKKDFDAHLSEIEDLRQKLRDRNSESANSVEEFASLLTEELEVIVKKLFYSKEFGIHLVDVVKGCRQRYYHDGLVFGARHFKPDVSDEELSKLEGYDLNGLSVMNAAAFTSFQRMDFSSLSYFRKDPYMTLAEVREFAPDTRPGDTSKVEAAVQQIRARFEEAKRKREEQTSSRKRQKS